MRSQRCCALFRLAAAGSLAAWVWLASAQAGDSASASDRARELVQYFERMCAPKPFVVRSGAAFTEHRAALRQRVQESVGLSPPPERVPLEPRLTEPLDHPWCRIQRVSYQLWPGVRAGGLLYRPKEWREKPAPGVLCPHGHWTEGNAHPIVQSRCLMLARLGYVIFSPDQNHYEDLNWGISHQTLGVWGNMRALDFLETLAEVNRERLGVCGASGGGLQTQMLLALDPRVKAATIVGMTCPFREILFPHAAHCGCNHFPGVMRFTDAPELSALGLPTPVQYLTMNDWTGNFLRDDFPDIARLYTANGWPGRARCRYEPTEHTYDRSKREWTYGWMEQWLRGSTRTEPPREPETIPTLPPQQLRQLTPAGTGDAVFAGISEAFQQRWSYRAPTFHDRAEWTTWRDRRVATLGELLGEDARLPRGSEGVELLSTNRFGDLVVERQLCPSEGGLRIPVACLWRPGVEGPLPVVLICSPGGQTQLLRETSAGSAQDLAGRGALVVLADVRFTGGYGFEALAPFLGPDLLQHRPVSLLLPAEPGPAQVSAVRLAWERNAILWGRPFTAMACTDLRAVLASLEARKDADLRRVRLIARGSGDLAVAALFAAARDPRFTAVDVDLEGACYANKRLTPVPFVLRHGDVLAWAALLADRELTLRAAPREAGDTAWLTGIFAVAGQTNRLTLSSVNSPGKE